MQLTTAAAAVVLLFVAPAAFVRSAMPQPLETVCVMDSVIGCYVDSFRRTFPIAISDGSGMPFASNMTLETCAFLCHKSDQKGAPFTAAAVEAGNQCFCANAESLVTAEPNRTNLSDCTELLHTANGREGAPTAGGLATPCIGNSFQMCGGAWRLLAYNFICHPYTPGSQPWQNYSLSANARVQDLVKRLSPPQLVAQLYMNGADIYGRDFQLPRYIPTQECLAGYDGGHIFLAPAVSTTASSAFPQVRCCHRDLLLVSAFVCASVICDLLCV
jgi:hypothetical protein